MDWTAVYGCGLAPPTSALERLGWAITIDFLFSALKIRQQTYGVFCAQKRDSLSVISSGILTVCVRIAAVENYKRVNDCCTGSKCLILAP